MGLAVLALSDHLKKLPEQMSMIDLQVLGLVMIGLILYQILNASLWAEVLKSLALRVPHKNCARIWIESESMKWLPGSVWSYGSRIVSAQRLSLTKKQTSISMVLEVILTNFAWAALAATIVFNKELLHLVTPALLRLSDHLLPLTIAASIIFALLIFHAKTIATRIQEIFTITTFHPLQAIKTAGMYLVLCLGNTALLWVLIQAVPNLTLNYSTTIVIASCAWLAGFWAIGIPGGIGVREAVLVIALSQYGSIESAILVSILWRAIQMISEISTLLLSFSLNLIELRFQKPLTPKNV